MTDQETAPVDGVEQAAAGQGATDVTEAPETVASETMASEIAAPEAVTLEAAAAETVTPEAVVPQAVAEAPPAETAPPEAVPAEAVPAVAAAPQAVAPPAEAGKSDTVGTAPPVVPVASDDPTRWGRVDEAGKVYVKAPEDPSGTGEREVGSWQAGEPAEGLAHFARRFDDMRTEVELLEARLRSGAGDPKQALSSAKHVRDGLAAAAVVGDLVALRARVDFVIASAGKAVDKAKVARDAARAESATRKQTLVEEAEVLANESTQWKTAGDRLRAILDEWKTIRGVDRKTDEQLWRRFSKARDAFNRRRGAHFADLDRQRSTAKTRKQELVDEAEALASSDDWGVTAGRYKDLMVEWKAAGRAPKESDDALWQAFRAAQDKFFARRSSAFDERDAEFGTNAKLKEELLAEAENIDPAGGLEAARNALYKLQERWDHIGKVPRERVRDLEGRLRAIEERVRGAVDAQWRRTDPEAEARVAQFRERVNQFEAQAAKARSAGDKRRAEQAEAQAAQWREWLAAAEQAVATR